MRKLLLLTVVAVMASVAQPAQAQFCPGVSPWVFDDVQASDPFCGYITWMAQNGISLGCQVIDANHRLYCPTGNVSRSQMAAFMNRLGNTAFMQGGNTLGTTVLLGTTDNYALEIRVNGARVMRYEPDVISPNLIGGSFANSAKAGVRGATIGGGGAPTGSNDPAFGAGVPNRVMDVYATVGGGFGNVAGSDNASAVGEPFATVGGGALNTAGGHGSTVGGGTANAASGFTSTIAGGNANQATGDTAAVAGGYNNHASGDRAFAGGGYGNVASGGYSVVAGGISNTASGQYSAVGGGFDNLASGDYSVAMGRRAQALGNGSFSFADSNNFDFGSVTANAFRVRATGGVRFVTDIDVNGNVTWSCLALAGASWACSSDRNLKHSLVELDGEAVLDKLAAMPVYQWQPKGQNAHVKHYGPMAQDFHAAFGLGDDDRMIGMQDVDGVALAAIRGLNARLGRAIADRDARIEAQAREIAELKSAHAMEIAELRRAVEVLLARTSPEGRVAAK